jgi:hypothetical protein
MNNMMQYFVSSLDVPVAIGSHGEQRSDRTKHRKEKTKASMASTANCNDDIEPQSHQKKDTGSFD